MVGRALRKSAFISHLLVIGAKVPIIKFHDSKNKIDCDINLNSHVGIRNTHLLKYYSIIDWRASPLILTVKRWAKYHDINDAAKQTLSSYSLALMTIFFLQFKCSPPVLPVLQNIYPEKFNSKSDITQLRLNDNISNWTSYNTQSLGELFLEFLDFYSTFP
jgi:poly(A) RNA polymerase GLD2